MWIFSKHGFYSIVRKSPNEYHVRARVKKDLENIKDLLELTEIIAESQAADYRYRLIVDHRVYLQVMALMTRSVDYDNFKNKIAMVEDQRKKLGPYHEVWKIMGGLQNS